MFGQQRLHCGVCSNYSYQKEVYSAISQGNFSNDLSLALEQGMEHGYIKE